MTRALRGVTVIRGIRADKSESRRPRIFTDQRGWKTYRISFVSPSFASAARSGWDTPVVVREAASVLAEAALVLGGLEGGCGC